LKEHLARYQFTDPRVEAALHVYLEGVDRGELLDREAFVARFPDFADTLRLLIAAEEEVRRLPGDRISSESMGISTQSCISQVQETATSSSLDRVESAGSGLTGRFGRYRIIRVLGQGAMGTVYLAQDAQIERLIALKTPHFNPEPSKEQKERFFREARAAGRLRHQNICPVHDFGEVDGRPYISMAYIEGRPLSVLIAQGAVTSEQQILTVIRKLAVALQEAHDHGIVHRDLKPSNIIVDTKDEPIITDFGLAHELDRGGDTRLTRPGIVMGTPAFMSPEQVKGNQAKIGPATDQYSLGVILFEWLTGTLPFDGSPLLLMGEILTKEPPPLNQMRPHIDPRIEAVCLRMLAKSPSDRFGSMSAVAEELTAILEWPSDTTNAEERAHGVTARVTERSSARVPLPKQHAARRKPNRWIRLSIAAVSLAALIASAAVIVIYLGKTAVLIDVKDPGIQVALNGTAIVVTGPAQQAVKVEPGDQELRITCAGLETTTKSFTLKKGEKRAVTISVVNSQLLALLDNEKGLSTSTSPAAGSEVEPNAKTAKPAGANKVTNASGTPASEPKAEIVPPQPLERPFLVRGDWSVESDELVQPTLAAATWTGDYNPLLVFGDETLTHYDFSVELKKTGGRDKIGVVFHWLGPGRYRSFALSRNCETDLAYMFQEKPGREDGNVKELRYSSNVWYSLKLEVRADTYRAFLDGALVFEQTDPRFSHGRLGLFTNNAAARFRGIRLTAANGNLLFQGLPQLPPAANRTALAHAMLAPSAGELTAKKEQEQWAQGLKTSSVISNSLGIKLALIPPGEFRMGSPESEKDRGEDEEQRDVRIAKPFCLGLYEVTQSQYQRVTGHNPSVFSNGGGLSEAQTGVDTTAYPVDSVSWYDAIEFCNRLSGMEALPPYYRIDHIQRARDGSISLATVGISGGMGYRLPTEPEWEYACRAGTATAFNFGPANNGTLCNCNDKGAYPDPGEPQGPALGRTVQVGTYRSNAFGLFDMHGNVCEWCWDVYAGTSQQNGGRVERGGSWGSHPVYCRSAVRHSDLPTFASDNLGFRIARSLEN
jgi:formylglycine-generating enzyme required for sulfatase activity/predicted Ser/Thr protein kinase